MSDPINRSIDSEDTYSKRLLKMLPTETATVCMAALGFIFSMTDTGALQTSLLWVVFVVGLVCTPLWLIYGMKVTKVSQIIPTTIAFVIWMMSIDGPFTTIPGYEIIIGGVLLILFSGIAAPLLGIITQSGK